MSQVWAPRVTVATVIQQNQRFLMVEEKVAGQQVFNQPAGHLEPYETLIEAVVREAKEETGWTIEPIALCGIYLTSSPNSDLSYLRFAFVAQALSFDDKLVLDDDIIQVHWLSFAEILAKREQMRSALIIKTLEDYQLGQRFSLSTVNHMVIDSIT